MTQFTSNLIDVLQLADNVSIITRSYEELSIAFIQLIEQSEKKYMVTNLDKTFYLNLSKDPFRQPIRISETQTIKHAENDQHLYLGMWIKSSNDITDHIKCNLNQKRYNIVKCLSWLEVNKNTPIKIKLQVLDSCMLAS